MTSGIRTIILVGFVASTTLLAGCGQSDADKIADAQACLDKATDSSALACMEKIEGLSSPASELIRCSAYFIDQGFSSSSRLTNIYEQLKNGGGSGSAGTVAVLSFMAFSAGKYDMTQNFTLSETAFNSCQKSLSGGLIYLSSMSRIATATLKALGSYDPTSGVPPTEAEIKTILCDPSGPPADTAIIIGSAAQIAYDQNCKGKEIDNDPVCKQYEQALAGGSTPQDVGNTLAENLCTP